MNDKNNIILISIVSIVAIVAIFIMVKTTTTIKYEQQDFYGKAISKINIDSKTLSNESKYYCYDSDGKINYYLRGTIHYSDGTTEESMTDYCRAYNSSTLVEFYCLNNSRASVDYVCINGCKDGACII